MTPGTSAPTTARQLFQLLSSFSNAPPLQRLTYACMHTTSSSHSAPHRHVFLSSLQHENQASFPLNTPTPSSSSTQHPRQLDLTSYSEYSAHSEPSAHSEHSAYSAFSAHSHSSAHPETSARSASSAHSQSSAHSETLARSESAAHSHSSAHSEYSAHSETLARSASLAHSHSSAHSETLACSQSATHSHSSAHSDSSESLLSCTCTAQPDPTRTQVLPTFRNHSIPVALTGKQRGSPQHPTLWTPLKGQRSDKPKYLKLRDLNSQAVGALEQCRRKLGPSLATIDALHMRQVKPLSWSLHQISYSSQNSSQDQLFRRFHLHVRHLHHGTSAVSSSEATSSGREGDIALIPICSPISPDSSQAARYTSWTSISNPLGPNSSTATRTKQLPGSCSIPAAPLHRGTSTVTPGPTGEAAEKLPEELAGCHVGVPSAATTVTPGPTGEAAQQLQEQLARCHVGVPAAAAVGYAFVQGQLPMEVDTLVERVESLRGQLGETSGDELMRNRPRVLVNPLEGVGDKVETLAAALGMPVDKVRTIVSRYPAWLSLTPSAAASHLSALSKSLSLRQGPRLHDLLYDAPSLLTRPLETISQQAVRMCSLLGVSLSEYWSLAVRRPRTLLVNPMTAESNISKLARMLGVEREEVCRMVLRYPELIRCQSEKLDANIAALQEQTGWRHEEVVCVVLKQPCLLAFQPESLVERLDVLGTVLQMERTKLLAACVRDSRILSFTPAALEAKLTVWQEILDVSPAVAAEVCLRTNAFTLAADNVQRKWRRLCEAAESSALWQQQLAALRPNSKVRCMQAGSAKYDFLEWVARHGLQSQISMYSALVASPVTVSKRFPEFKAV